MTEQVKGDQKFYSLQDFRVDQGYLLCCLLNELFVVSPESIWHPSIIDNFLPLMRDVKQAFLCCR
jgi:hypothetical protein